MKAWSSVLVLGALLAASGCGAGQARWSAEAAQYAVYATQIPLFPGTTIEDAMGHESWGDEPDSYSYGMTWWCETEGSKEEILEFYRKVLDGEVEEIDEDGGVKLTVLPDGGQLREDMGVYVTGDGEYRVFEHTQQKKPGT